MAKHIIKISIVLVWIGLMGWWWLESRTWPVPEKIDAAFLPDFNDYYGLSYGEQKIGWANKSLRRTPEGGYQGLQALTVRLAVQEEAVDINFSVTANFDRVLNLTDFRYMIQAGPMVAAETGQVNRPLRDDCPDETRSDQAPADGTAPPAAAPCPPGLADGSEARLRVEVNLGEIGPFLQDLLEQHRDLLGDLAGRLDFSRPVDLDLPTGPGLMQFIPSYLSYLGLTPGANYSMTMLDPAGRALTPVAVRVEDEAREYDQETGRDITVYRIRLTSGSGTGLLWLDRYGRTVREETLGFKLERVINMANKFEESAMAAQGVTPLKPPPGLQRLFSGGKMGELLDLLQKPSQQPRDEAVPATGPQPEDHSKVNNGGEAIEPGPEWGNAPLKYEAAGVSRPGTGVNSHQPFPEGTTSARPPFGGSLPHSGHGEAND